MECQVRYMVNPMIDLAASLHRIANRDEYNKWLHEKWGYKPNEEIAQWLDEVEERMSRFYLREIDFFFSKPLQCAYMIGRFIIDHKLEGFDALAQFIEKRSASQFVRDVLSYVLVDDDKQIDEAGLNWVMEKQENLQEYVGRSMELSEGELERLMELYRYQEDAKERFSRLLEKYYEMYREKLTEVKDKLEVALRKYRRICEKDRNAFFDEYLKVDYKSLTDSPEIIMVPSFYQEIGITIVTDDEGIRPTIIMFGCDIEKRILKERQTEKRKLFFKILSEEKRIDIIKMLASRPHYVHELGKALGLTSATISYHIGLLTDLGIVKLEKDGHRFYYELQKNKLKDLFEIAYDELIH